MRRNTLVHGACSFLNMWLFSKHAVVLATILSQSSKRFELSVCLILNRLLLFLKISTTKSKHQHKQTKVYNKTQKYVNLFLNSSGSDKQLLLVILSYARCHKPLILCLISSKLKGQWKRSKIFQKQKCSQNPLDFYWKANILFKLILSGRNAL